MSPRGDVMFHFFEEFEPLCAHFQGQFFKGLVVLYVDWSCSPWKQDYTQVNTGISLMLSEVISRLITSKSAPAHVSEGFTFETNFHSEVYKAYLAICWNITLSSEQCFVRVDRDANEPVRVTKPVQDITSTAITGKNGPLSSSI
jgi:hypothetical protein